MQKTEGFDFYNLVGGRVKMGESTEQAIKREIKEELGVDADVSLLKICENFFNWMGTDVQELLFIYRAELKCKNLSRFDGFRICDSENEFAHWIDIDKLKEYNCKPEIIYTLPNIKELAHEINM